MLRPETSCPCVQFLKLGAAVALPSLSSSYLVWDMDMILLRVPRLWVTPPRRIGSSEPRRVRPVPLPGVHAGAAPWWLSSYCPMHGKGLHNRSEMLR